MEAIIRCDVCGNEFKLNKFLKTTYNRLTIHYFTCSNCGFCYVVKIDDTLQKRYDARIQTIQNEIETKRKRNKPISQARLRQLNRLFEESKVHQATLRDRYRGAVTAQLNADFNETNSITG